MDNHGVARTHTMRTEEQRQNDLEKIAKYRGLDDEFCRNASQQNFTPKTFALTTRLLRLNPEHYTAWNVRRRCLVSSILTTSSPSATSPLEPQPGNPADPSRPPGGSPTDDSLPVPTEVPPEKNTQQTLRSELLFTIPLLQSFPKCYWIWNHRLWSLKRCITLLPRALARSVWEEELALAGKMLTRDQRNFHAWGYRRKLVAQLESDDLSVTNEDTLEEEKSGGKHDQRSMVEKEFEYTTRMTKVDLSNFSAWHRRGELITRLLDERGAGPEERKKLLNNELEHIRGGLDVGPEDQSIWYYHQLLMRHVIPDKTLPASSSIAPSLTPSERLDLATREIDAIRELLEDFPDVKRVYEALVEYAMTLPGVRREQGMEGAALLKKEEVEDIKKWVSRLKELDPMRTGRWVDVERGIKYI